MAKLRKFLSLFLLLCCVVISPLVFACDCNNTNDDDPNKNQNVEVPILELLYTDIHMLENSSIDVKLSLEPTSFENLEVLINLPSSNVVTSAEIITKENERYLRITSSSFIQNENEVLNGAYIYLKDYTNSTARKSFTVTVHKNATILEIPSKLTYDENLGTIEWEAVEYARYYEVNINGQTETTTLNSLVLNQSYYGHVLSVKVRALYDLTGEFPTFINSSFSEPISFMVLTRPNGLTHTNKIISWNKVLGAESYTIIISTPSLFGDRENVREIEVLATEDEIQTYSGYGFETSTTYTLRVRANGNPFNLNYVVYGTQDSESITVQKFNAPENVTFLQGVVSWDEVEGASGYLVSVLKYDTNQGQFIETLSKEVKNANHYIYDNFESDILSGEYKFSVKTLGNGTTTLTGSVANEVVSTKLQTVQNVKIEEGLIKWDEVPYATSYTIYVNSTAINLVKEENKDLNQFDLINQGFVSSDYQIRVMACGDGITYFNSNKSTVLSTYKLSIDEANLTLVKSTVDKLIWTKIDGANEYLIDINGQLESVGDNNEYIIPTNLPSGEYSVKLLAVGENKLKSEFSSTKTFTKLETPSNLRVENGIVKWDTIDENQSNKYSYNLSVKRSTTVGTSTESDNFTVNGVNIYSYDFSGKPAGIYEMSLSVTGDNNTLTSAPTEILTGRKLLTPNAPYIKGGKFSYDSVSEGKLMVRVVNGTSKKEMEVENYVPNQNGEVKLSLFVQGNTTSENTENLISSSESEVLVLNVINTLTKPYIVNGQLKYTFPAGITGIQIDYLRASSTQIIKTVVQNKDETSSETDFVGYVDMYCYQDETMGAGTYNLNITPILSDATVETIKNGGKAYIYTGKELKLTFCQLDKPSVIGSYSLESEAKALLQTKESLEDFNEKINEYNQNKYAGYLYWSQIKDATAYLLRINEQENNVKTIYPTELIYTDDGLCLYRLDSTFTTTNDGYKFEVKAVGNESTYLSGQYSTVSDTKIMLEKIGSIQVKNGDLYWDKANGDVFYEVVCNGNVSYTYENTYTLPTNYAGGTYSIKVRVMPAGQYHYASDYVESKSIVKINSPQTFKVSSGDVTWSNVVNASKYSIKIEKGDEIYQDEFDISQIGFDFKELINSLDEFTEKTGTFTITLKAIGTEDSTINSSDTYYVSSSDVTCTTTIMKAPESIYVNEGKLTWTKVVGAQGNTESDNKYSYMVIIRFSSGYEKTITTKTNEFSMDSSYSAGIYHFDVCAVGDGSSYITSDFSELNRKAEKLSVITNIGIDKGCITFDEKVGAGSYMAQIRDYETQGEYSYEGFDTTSFSLGQDYKTGKYEIYIRAIGNTTSAESVDSLCYLSSDYSSVVKGYSETNNSTRVNYVYKLPLITNLNIAEDRINWLRVTNASSYNIKVDESIIPLDDETYTTLNNIKVGDETYTFTSGTYMVNVQACGGKYYLNSNFLDEAIEATKLEEVNGLRVENGVIVWNTIDNVPNNLTVTIKSGEDDPITLNLRKDFFSTYNSTQGGVIGDTTYFILGEDYPSGSYDITFKNIGGGTTGYLSSNETEKLTVIKLAKPNNLQIDSNTNSIVWDMDVPDNVPIKYVIDFYDYGTKNLVKTYESLEELSTEIEQLTVGQYNVYISAVVNSTEINYLNSGASNENFVVTMPAIPTNVSIQNGVVSWDKMEGVSGYGLEFSFYEGLSVGLVGVESKFTIKLSGANNNKVSLKDFTNDSTFESLLTDKLYHCANTALGKYKVRVKAFVSNSLQSDYTDFVGDNSDITNEGYYVFNMFADGKGIVDSPYGITSVTQLQNIKYLPDCFYKQKTDIIADGIPFSPIGTSDNKFSGVYDGANYKIKELVIGLNNVENEKASGLFGYTESSAIIKNIIIEEMTTSQGYYVGGICGYNEGIIYNCEIKKGGVVSTTKTISSTPIHIGGIVGFNAKNAIVDNCRYNGYVSAKETVNTYTSYSGGICGYNEGQIMQCQTSMYDETDLIEGVYSGGIVGYNFNTIAQTEGDETPNGSIIKCINKINVKSYSLKSSTTSIPGYAGGIVGLNELAGDYITSQCINSNYSVSFCSAICDVIADTNGTTLIPAVGGLVGLNANGIYSSYFIGNVYGLVNEEIYVDTVVGASLVHTGRICGMSDNLATYEIRNCFFIVLTDETLNSVGMQGKESYYQNFKNCMAKDDTYMKTANFASDLNVDIPGGVSIWVSSGDDYPTYNVIERTFD